MSTPSPKRIPVAGPWITEKEVDYVTDAVRRAWYADANVYHERFEQAFASYLGVRHAIALPSCTSAIHLALLALGVGPGDEVVIPDATWIASAAPITYVGATPVFADVDPSGWCLTSQSLDQCVTERTKAVIVVDLYGNVPDMDAIRDVASRRGIAVIEDAAEAVGADYHGRKAGSLGDVGTFSFHGSKTLTTGEGGMLVTNNDRLRERVLFQRDHGRAPGAKLFWNTEIAYKYKMSSMQAALGLAQLERVDELLARKREAFRWYQEELSGLADIQLNQEAHGTHSSFWMVTALVPAVDKEVLMARLASRGVDSRPFFYPLSSLPAYERTPGVALARARNRVAYELGRIGINLPSNLLITRDDVHRVAHALAEALAH